MLLTLHVPIAFAFGILYAHPCEKGAAGAQSVATMCSAAPGPAACTSVGPPSTTIFAAEDGSGGVDGPYSLVMISLFRLAFGQALGYQSLRALWDYEGLVELARRLYTSLPGDAEREKCVGDLFRAFPSHPQLLQDNRLSAELLGLLTSTLFPFLVGPCHVEQWDRTAGTETAPPEQWRSKVVIERCRFLEASQCKGMCLGLCKQPSEAYFTERGLPLSMTPNFEDGSCEMVWGRTPQEEDMDGANLACFGDCALLRGRHGERQA